MKVISVTLARTDENLRAAGCSRAVLATVCGMKASTLSAAYAGTVSLGGPREAELLTVSHRLLDLRTALSPLEPPRNAAQLKILVDRLQDGVLTTEQIREAVSRLFE
jgi:hypothetical protein